MDCCIYVAGGSLCGHRGACLKKQKTASQEETSEQLSQGTPETR